MSTVDHLVLFGPPPDRSALGRVYCYWLIAQELGWRFDYVCWEPTAAWFPLRNEFTFLDQIQCVADLPHAQETIERLGSSTRTAVVAVKNLPLHLELLRRCDTPGPKIVDIDDPQVESRLERMSTRQRWGLARPSLWTHHRHPLQYHLARRPSRRFLIAVSNPALEEVYGGAVIPHVRLPVEAPAAVSSDRDGTVRLCFVGTARAHKGVELLRAAAALIAGHRPVELTITDAAPSDARPWERWIGRTSLGEGMAITSRSLVAVFPSGADTWGRLQLPVKLVDAMILGRPLVVTPLRPLLWAAGRSAVVVPHDDAGAIARVVDELADDPKRRAELGTLARERAGVLFTPEAAAQQLVGLVN